MVEDRYGLVLTTSSTEAGLQLMAAMDRALALRGGARPLLETAVEIDPKFALKDIAAMGVTITQLTPAERAAFVKVTRPVYDKWKPMGGNDLVNKAEKAIAARKQ